jgi:thiosulfate/3-mercaptopyruvate sulfurtransferase
VRVSPGDALALRPGLARPPLVEPEELAAGALGEGTRILELSLTREGARFADGHLPGASWVYWKDLLWCARLRCLRDPEDMARALDRALPPAGGPLVLYAERIQFAVYAYWTLAAIGGRDGVFVLNGGATAWAAAGRRLEAGERAGLDVGPTQALPADRSSARYRAHVATRDDVRAVVDGRVPGVLVDLRSEGEYLGSAADQLALLEVCRGGHIEGAISLPHLRLVDGHGALRPVEECREEVLRALGLTAPDREVICYCRSGHRSALGWLVLEGLMGISGVRVYMGSWLEWANLVDAPIVPGDPV